MSNPSNPTPDRNLDTIGTYRPISEADGAHLCPIPFHFRAGIDQLWRRANSNAPGYRRLNALDAIVREMFAPNDRARHNYQTYLATDPFDVARHKLRDLYDRADPTTPGGASALCPPSPSGRGLG